MFGSLKRLIDEFGGDEQTSRFDEGDYRLCAAALLVHAASIDGSISDAERARLHDMLKRTYSLDDAAADTLVNEAIEAERQSVDLYRFTSRLDRSLDEAGRRRVVEMLWEIVFADNTVSEFEDNLIWRAADLLHVPREERIALRQRVAQAAGKS